MIYTVKRPPRPCSVRIFHLKLGKSIVILLFKGETKGQRIWVSMHVCSPRTRSKCFYEFKLALQFQSTILLIHIELIVNSRDLTETLKSLVSDRCDLTDHTVISRWHRELIGTQLWGCIWISPWSQALVPQWVGCVVTCWMGCYKTMKRTVSADVDCGTHRSCQSTK